MSQKPPVGERVTQLLERESHIRITLDWKPPGIGIQDCFDRAELGHLVQHEHGCVQVYTAFRFTFMESGCFVLNVVRQGATLGLP